MPICPLAFPHRRGIWATLAAALVFLLGTSRVEAFRTENVVLVVVDGPRMTETFEEPGHPHIPGIWNLLRPKGGSIPEFRNEGLTFTSPGHAAILTGTWQDIANDGSERPGQPTLFEYYRAATGAPISDVWLVTGKLKLNACAYSTHPDYGSAFRASVNNANRFDLDTYAEFKEIMSGWHPTLSLLGLSEVDIQGHSNNWNGYLAAITRVDSLIVDLWTWLEHDKTYAGRTTVILTYDHGRHLDLYGGFQNHGDDCIGCVRMGFLAIGPDFARGSVSSFTRTLRDICPTVAELLGFEAPMAEGNTLAEIFLVPTAIDLQTSTTAVGTIAGLEAFPNPFNPAVRITLRLKSEGLLSLDVEDALGRRVRRLAEAHLARGVHPFVWDGRDGSARRVGSGVYFIVAESGGEKELKKITLLR